MAVMEEVDPVNRQACLTDGKRSLALDHYLQGAAVVVATHDK